MKSGKPNKFITGRRAHNQQGGCERPSNHGIVAKQNARDHLSMHGVRRSRRGCDEIEAVLCLRTAAEYEATTYYDERKYWGQIC